VIGTVQASKIAEKIKSSEKTLQSAESEKKQTNEQLSRIARSIKKTEQEIVKLEKILDRLEREKDKGESRYKNAKNKIEAYSRRIEELDRSIKEKHDMMVRRISEQLSIVAAINRLRRQSEKSIIKQEIYEVYRQINRKELKKLRQTMEKNLSEKAALERDRSRLEKSIEGIVKKRNLYQQKKKKTEELLKKLADEEAVYRKKLKNLIVRQNLLRLTLARLNILQKEEIEEARRREAERKAQLERRAKKLEALRKKRAADRARAKREGKKVDYTAPRIVEESAGDRVKQYGSSYHRERVYSYRGPKTISPLYRVKLVKKFGTYVDPIYKIKIFNDSITLKAPKRDAKVRNVLNGKVVYIGRNSMLGRVVIIAHSGKLHTVYAGLSKISPLIKTGSRVKKGSVIGKVKRKLIFQATKNSKLINPVRLITL
jgi:murein DD-endopeptidase MepM/ murein hydrolase activator NlpD